MFDQAGRQRCISLDRKLCYIRRWLYRECSRQGSLYTYSIHTAKESLSLSQGRGDCVHHGSASSRFAVFFLGLSNQRIAYSCIKSFLSFESFSVGEQRRFFVCNGFSRKERQKDQKEGTIAAIVIQSGQRSPWNSKGFSNVD